MKLVVCFFLCCDPLWGGQGPGAIRFTGGSFVQVRFPVISGLEGFDQGAFEVKFMVAVRNDGKISATQLLLNGRRVDLRAIPIDYPQWKRNIIQSIVDSHESFLLSPFKDEKGNAIDDMWIDISYELKRNGEGVTQTKIFSNSIEVACDNPRFSES